MRRRLDDGRRALELPEPKTAEEALEHLRILFDGALAMQSLDDLGSKEANEQAWRDMQAIERRWERLKERLRAGEFAR